MSTPTAAPYLSVVAAARNDDHGGNLLARIQLFVDGLLRQCSRYGLAAELVLVEWNPPADRPGLAEALSWTGPTDRCPVRIVKVPPRVHRRFRHADVLPLFQMIAKNAGIRRAGGRFVLATNVDVLLADDLVCFLSREQLQPGSFYRATRFDVPADVPAELPIASQLKWCHDHVMRVSRRECTLNLLNGSRHVVLPRLTALRWVMERAQDIGIAPVRTRARLHTNACGDFTLLAATDWARLRGYPEFEMFSMHLDSYFCFAAHHAGLRERVLPERMRVYHIEHATGSGFTPEGEPALLARVDGAGIRRLSDADIDGIAVAMRRGVRPIPDNGDDWGLANESLEEVRISG